MSNKRCILEVGRGVGQAGEFFKEVLVSLKKLHDNKKIKTIL